MHAAVWDGEALTDVPQAGSDLSIKDRSHLTHWNAAGVACPQGGLEAHLHREEGQISAWENTCMKSSVLMQQQGCSFVALCADRHNRTEIGLVTIPWGGPGPDLTCLGWECCRCTMA